MKKRKVKKSVIKLVLRIVSIFIICYFFITAISYGVRIKNLSNKKIEYSDYLNELIENEEKLKTDILKLNDKEYIARYAREHYLYTKDGELALKIDNSNNIDEAFSRDSNYSYIYIGLGVSFVVLILIIINHKRKVKRKLKKSRN